MFKPDKSICIFCPFAVSYAELLLVSDGEAFLTPVLTITSHRNLDDHSCFLFCITLPEYNKFKPDKSICNFCPFAVSYAELLLVSDGEAVLTPVLTITSHRNLDDHSCFLFCITSPEYNKFKPDRSICNYSPFTVSYAELLLVSLCDRESRQFSWVKRISTILLGPENNVFSLHICKREL